MNPWTLLFLRLNLLMSLVEIGCIYRYLPVLGKQHMSARALVRQILVMGRVFGPTYHVSSLVGRVSEILGEGKERSCFAGDFFFFFTLIQSMPALFQPARENVHPQAVDVSNCQW